jgi:hypothetical protein
MFAKKLVGLTIVLGLAVWFGAIAEAGWLSDYVYRKKITITGQPGAGTNYQVRLLIGKTSDAAGEDFDLEGRCMDSFNDIRFTDNDETTELDYWVESVKDSGGTKLATVWVKVAGDLGSDQDIYIYYGKAGDSSASNPRSTFIVWDDFDGGDEQWTEVDNADKITIDRTTDKRIEVVQLRMPELGYVYKGKDVYDFLMEIEVTPSDNWGGNRFLGVSDTLGAFTSWSTYICLAWSTPGGTDVFRFGTNLEYGPNHDMTLHQSYYFTICRLGSIATLKAYSDADRTNLLWEDSVSAPPTLLNYIYPVSGYYVEGASSSYFVSYYIGDILVRKYASPEPGFSSAGSQEATGINISGTIYTNEAKTGNVGSGVSVGLSVSGAVKTTNTTTAFGGFSFSGISINADDTVTIFIDNDTTYEANLITRAVDGSSNIIGLEMYTNKIVLRHETTGPMDNALLAIADNSGDDDIHYVISDSNVDFADGYELWIDSGKTYTPGGTVEADDLEVCGTGAFNPGANPVTIHGDWKVSATGSFASSGAVTFDGASGTQTFVTGGTDEGHDFQNITKSGEGSLQLATNDIDIDGDLTISASGALDLNSQDLNLSGTFTNNGTLILHGSETVTTIANNPGSMVKYNGTSGPYTLKNWTYDSLQLSSASATTYNLPADLTVNADLAIAGNNTLDATASNYNVTIKGNWTNSGIFVCRTGTVIFNGTIDQIITTNNKAFYNLTINNTGSPGADDIIISGDLDIDGKLTITDGDLDCSAHNPNLFVSGDFEIGSSGSFTKGTGVLTFDGTSGFNDNTTPKQDLGTVKVD